MTKTEFLQKVTSRLKYNPIWSRILKWTGKDSKEKKWIFITGCYNSGTTLLDQILADHPAISGLPDEGVMLTSELPRPEDFGWRRMWSQCEDQMENSPRNRNKNAKTIKKHWSHFYDLDKEFLLEKSISNSTRLQFLNENFKPACFIHMVRNGYAVAEGIRRKTEIMPGNPYYEKGKYPYSLTAAQWVRSIEIVEENRAKLDDFIEISYEALCENPSAIINELLEKIGLDPFPDAYFDTSFSIHEKNSRIKNMNASSFKRMTKEDFAEINKVAKDCLLKKGYKIVNACP